MVIRGIIFGSQAKERRGLGDIDLLVVLRDLTTCPAVTTSISSGGLQPARTAGSSLFPAGKTMA